MSDIKALGLAIKNKEQIDRNTNKLNLINVTAATNLDQIREDFAGFHEIIIKEEERQQNELERQQNETTRQANELLRQQRIAELEELDLTSYQTRLLNLEEMLQTPKNFNFIFDERGMFKKLEEVYSTTGGDITEYVEIIERQRNLVTKLREYVRQGATFKTYEYEIKYAVDITDGVCTVQMSNITKREIA